MGEITTVKKNGAQPRDDYLVGLDVVRVSALSLITAQHALTLLAQDVWTVFAGLSIGQVGVAIFLAVSALLASESRRPPVGWLLQRLRRLFPAFWVAMVASFFLTWLVGYKHFDANQVVAQLCGIGLFTHLDNLVNTSTWFVSLLLVCYLGSFVVRLVNAPVVLGVFSTTLLAILVGLVAKPWLLSHLFTYALANTVALVPRKYRFSIALAFGSVLFVLSVWWQPAFGYTAVAIISVELALCLQRTPRLVHLAAKYSYEYYLVHGLALFGVIWLLPSFPLIAVSCAITLGAAIAVALHWTVDRLAKILARSQCHLRRGIAGGLLGNNR